MSPRVGGTLGSRDMRSIAPLALCGLLQGCVLQPVDLDGKACPCASGWVCDGATQTCRTASAGATSSSTGDPPASDSSTTSDPASSTSGRAASSSGDEATSRFDVLAFSADWSTPESIHWTWEVVGAEADFHAWEIWIATDEDALTSGRDVQVFDGTTNPELDRFVLKNTQGVDPVVGALTRGLLPGTEYFARLVVFDTAGGRTESPNVGVRSTNAAPTEEVVIFADDPLQSGGYPLPACFTRSEVAPHAGTHDFAVQLGCTADEATCGRPDPSVVDCWENLRLQQLSIPLVGLGGGDLSDAFLEFHISIEAPEATEGHGWWSMAGIHLEDRNFAYAPLTIPASGEYHRFQLPLSVLGVTLRDLPSPLSRVYVGSTWQNGSQLRVDEIRVRW